jgi:eukaryotic-like serine/threonine-protein kinase
LDDTFQVNDVILDKYKVTAILGQGGMGVVLAARHLKHDGLVALKFLLPSLRDKPGVSARFEQEARTAIRIKNPHVAQVYDVDTFEGRPFIVMEHLTGCDLATMIRTQGQLDISEAADFLLQACDAVSAAHALGVVHRDLKPANLFVATDPEGGRSVKVLDFGISKSAETSDLSMTASTAVLGSPQYMSPEQLMSAKNVDPRSDVWALGVILYEMLTGVPPFTGETFAAVCTAIQNCKPKKPTERRPDTPPALEEAIADALVVHREDRLQSVDDFAEQLAPFARQAGLAAYDRIRRRASRSQPPSAIPEVAADSQERSPSPSGPNQTTTASGSVTTDASVARVQARPGRWRGVTAIGVVVAAAGVAVALPRLRPASAPSSEPVASASVDLARASAAGPGSTASAESEAKPEALAKEDTNPAASATTAPSSASPRADEPRPTARSGSIGSTAAEPGGGAGAAKPSSSGGAACASGANAACEAACAANQPGSCLSLAKALDKGLGAPRNPGRAASLYQTTCDGGAMLACNNLGALYAAADGVSKDAARAIALYTRACDGGFAMSCVNLGAMHYGGNGVERNELLGAQFFLKGCQAGDAQGCLNVSIAYAEGRGKVTKDPGQAFVYAERACAAGALVGCVRAELARIAGDGVSKDVKSGLAQLDALCTRREPTACEDLAQMYTHGLGTDAPADQLRVRDYRKKACDAGLKQSCDAAQLASKTDSANSSDARGNAGFQTKCDAGDPVGCGMLGENLLAGNGTSVDRVKGVALLKKACGGGFERACKKLGEVGDH